MKHAWLLRLALVVLCSLSATGAAARSGGDDFSLWLEDFEEEAISAGISRTTLEALSGIGRPLPRVVELDRSQPERTLSLEEYVGSRVDSGRVAAGRRMMKRYPTWLGRVARAYGVQPRFVVALWGIETGYGEHTGGFPVLRTLVSLAYDGRRGEYFRRELLAALHIVDAGHIAPGRMKGSWAGAMGQCQFMPSSFRSYAVDADRDGRTDIWSSVPDVMASTANYLARAGWKNDQTWGRPVRLPEGFDPDLAGLENRLPLSRWQSLGVRRSNGNALPRRNLRASLILPDGPEGTAYLVYDNFRTLLRWNRSLSFAVAVGTLADRIATAR